MSWRSLQGGKRIKAGEHSRVRALVRGGLTAGMVAATGCADTVVHDRSPADETMPDGSLPGSGGVAGSAPAMTGGNASTIDNPPNVLPPFGEMDAGPALATNFLADQAVANAFPVSRVLYSWTTQEQYEALRAGGELLVRTERPGAGGGLIRQELASLAAADDPIARALTAPEFQRARYAWPNPWATLLGWPGESYGTKLIQIELREEAWLVVVQEGWARVVDSSGADVPQEEALASPERIGAIFHVHWAEDTGCYGSFNSGGAGSFREYFLPNAAMIARWSLDTEEMRDRLAADLDVLSAYRDHRRSDTEQLYIAFETAVACGWQFEHRLSHVAGLDAYVDALALASPLYEPTVANLDALIVALEGALFEPNPFVHNNP